jgi:hypothetical protein
MILHNKKNGETCWFQTADTPDCDKRPKGKGCDGTNVPAPHTAAATTFWHTPEDTAVINCVSCHDNGPWMNSRWMDNSGVDLKDNNPNGKYLNNGYAFSTPDSKGRKWAETKFVTVARAGLEDHPSADACTKCHRIHPEQLTPDPNAPFGQAYKTFQRWLDYAVGKAFPPAANATAQEFGRAFWMPTSHGEENAADWAKIYQKHVNQLKKCMAAGANRVAGTECQDLKVAFNTRPSGPGGARMFASVDGGATYPYSREVELPPRAFLTTRVAAGRRLMLSLGSGFQFRCLRNRSDFSPGRYRLIDGCQHG